MLAWPVKLGLWTLMLWRRSWSWCDGLPPLGLAGRVEVMGSHALAWPSHVGGMDALSLAWALVLGSWTPTVCCGPLSWVDLLPHFVVGPRVGVPHQSVGVHHYNLTARAKSYKSTAPIRAITPKGGS